MSPKLPHLECARCGHLAPVHPVLGIACPCAAWDRDIKYTPYRDWRKAKRTT